MICITLQVNQGIKKKSLNLTYSTSKVVIWNIPLIEMQSCLILPTFKVTFIVPVNIKRQESNENTDVKLMAKRKRQSWHFLGIVNVFQVGLVKCSLKLDPRVSLTRRQCQILIKRKYVLNLSFQSHWRWLSDEFWQVLIMAVSFVSLPLFLLDCIFPILPLSYSSSLPALQILPLLLH